KAALSYALHIDEAVKRGGLTSFAMANFWAERGDEIIHALKIADKLMQEPSGGVFLAFDDNASYKVEFNDIYETDDAYLGVGSVTTEFKAMRGQLLTEIGE